MHHHGAFKTSKDKNPQNVLVSRGFIAYNNFFVNIILAPKVRGVKAF